MREASINFSFSSPAPEDVTTSTMDGITGPQPSPENLRQHQEDQSSLNISDNEDAVREDTTEPSLVLCEDKDTAYEETVSPGPDPDGNTDAESGVTSDEETNEDLEDDLDMTWPVNQELLVDGKFPLDLDFYRDAYREASIAAKQWQIPISDGILQSNWHRDNWDKICIGEAPLQKIVDFEQNNQDYLFNKLILEREARFSLAEINHAVDWDNQPQGTNEELNREFNNFKKWIAGKRFEHYLQHCKKPKSYIGKHQKEPCNSPHIVACICE